MACVFVKYLESAMNQQHFIDAHINVTVLMNLELIIIAAILWECHARDFMLILFVSHSSNTRSVTFYLGSG